MAYCISGCARSGTSLAMGLLRIALGADRIYGDKFPQKADRKRMLEQWDKEGCRSARLYIERQTGLPWDVEFQKVVEMNPHGFWEHPFTVQGMRYSAQFHDVLNDIENRAPPGIIKLVAQGLFHSDPRYIDRVIYMLRDPKEVAKSQERLKRAFVVQHPDTGEVVDLGKQMRVHSPQMFNNTTAMAAMFFAKNPHIPLLVIRFQDLVDRPDDTLSHIKDFLGEKGDFGKAAQLVTKTLHRSKAVEGSDEIPMWQESQMIHDMFFNRQFEQVVEYMEDPRRGTNRIQRNWTCLRTNLPTVENHCRECMANPEYRVGLKRHAESHQVDWKNKPCMFQCGMDLDNDKPMTPQESVDQNFWVEEHA